VNIAKGKVGFVEPMLALAVTKLSPRNGLGVQLKFDSYRAPGVKAKGNVPLLSHNGKWSNPSNRFTRVDSPQKLNYKRSPMSVWRRFA
jgi:hypothetical protein